MRRTSQLKGYCRSIWQTLCNQARNVRLLKSINLAFGMLTVVIVSTIIITSFIALLYLNVKEGFTNLALSGGLLAITTIVLAIAAFGAIWQNHSLQKRERKERLLNEIIEWAVEVAVCAFSVPYSMMIEDITGGLEMASVEMMVRRGNITTYTNLRLRYQTVARKSKYIENIASSFPGNLDSAVRNLSKKIDDVVRELRKCAKDPDDRDRSKYKNLIKAEELLHEQADILIEEAAKIKGRDIG